MKENMRSILKAIERLHVRPALFAPGTENIWTEAHLAKGMLEAHLNPENDAASYSASRRGEALAWIEKAVPPDAFPRVIDLGCGPGLYAQALARRGYSVTGIDFSSRSLAYAREQAARAGTAVRYLQGDYLQTDFEAPPQGYDLAMMISCDFGVLSTPQRARLLEKTYASLRPGGCLLLDVLTTDRASNADRWQSWECGDGGYWSPGPYLLLTTDYQYPDHDTCRQSILWDEEGVRSFHIWDHRFTPAEIARDMQAAGFEMPHIYGDLKGRPYREGGDYFCACAAKP